MSDWIAETAMQFVRSPIWTTPVQNFIETNCVVFDNEEEMKLEYTSIHKQFKEMIEDILEAFLEELGIGPQELIDSCEENRAKDPKIARFLQYLLTLDDFQSFRKMMVKRNLELEAEAMAAWAKMQEQHAKDQLAGAAPPAEPEAKPEAIDGDEAELEAALKASLNANDLIMKQAELEDAELQQALALSVAEEKDRVQREEAALNAKKEAEEAAAKEEAEKKAADEARLHQLKEEEIKREEEHKKKMDELEEKKRQAEAKVAAMEAEALAQRKKNLEQAAAEAEKAQTQGTKATEVPQSKSSNSELRPENSEVIRKSLTQVEPASKLPSLGDVSMHRSTGGFGKMGALPSLGPISSSQPSFDQLKKDVTPTTAPANSSSSAEEKAAAEAKSKAEFEARAKYMKEQRNKLVAQRAKERGEAMDSYAKENGIPAASKSSQPANGSDHSADAQDEAHKAMTRALLRRFKDDIVHESTK